LGGAADAGALRNCDHKKTAVLGRLHGRLIPTKTGKASFGKKNYTVRRKGPCLQNRETNKRGKKKKKAWGEGELYRL